MLLRRYLFLIVNIITLCIIYVQAQDERRSLYRFNHPPLIESLETVPVAVVYENGDFRENKAIKLPAESQTTLDEDSSTTIGNVESVPETKDNMVEIPGTKGTQAISRTYSEIPVKVIYEQDTKESVHESSTASPRKKNQRRRRLQNAHKEEKLQDQITSERNKLREEKAFLIEATTSLPKIDKPNTPAANDTQTTTGKFRQFKKRTGTRDPVVPIVNEQNFVFAHSGNFHYSFEGGDGTKVFEEGILKTINDDTGEAVQGGFSYKDKEGNDYSLSYTADENGYRPIGAHLPTPPPIPPAIARALAYLATKSTPESTTEAERNFY
ncbi:uncharacterized protein [Battus philenor]|uniref:uncharacterized protein n=1 Tax=Battus philenor TaxID=42288 RepID=UPI0035D0FD0F